MPSVLRRVSVPVLHSAAALLRMAEMPYSGTTSFFIRVLLDKKYALPYRVVDALVDHFVRFRREERTLPVVWHQALLCFVQRRGPACVMPLHAFVMFTYLCRQEVANVSVNLTEHLWLSWDRRYKNEVRAEDKEALRRLIKAQFHYQVTPEVLRELDASRCGALSTCLSGSVVDSSECTAVLSMWENPYLHLGAQVAGREEGCDSRCHACASACEHTGS